MTFTSSKKFAKKNFIAALGVASILLLSTGCAPDAGLFGGDGSGSGSSNSRGAGSPSPRSDKNGGENSGEKENSAHANLTGKDCLPGTWLLDNKAVEKFMETLSVGATVVKTTGQVIAKFGTDGITQTNYDHWTNTITMTGGTSSVERHGIDAGTYSVSSAGKLTVNDTAIGSVTTVTATVAGGESMKMSVDPEPTIFGEGEFDCTGDTVTITVDGGQLIVMHRQR